MKKVFIYFNKACEMKPNGTQLEAGRCYGYNFVGDEDAVEMVLEDEVLIDLTNYVYLDGALVYSPPPPPEPTFEEVQTDLNIEYEYRFACIELGL